MNTVTCLASIPRYDPGAECASVVSRPQARMPYNFRPFLELVKFWGQLKCEKK